jgi:hypothetical protein
MMFPSQSVTRGVRSGWGPRLAVALLLLLADWGA